MPTQNKFYLIPKERIVNLLDVENSLEANGTIVCRYYTTTKFTLRNYAIPEKILVSENMQMYLGMIGTHMEIESIYSDAFKAATKYLETHLKEFEF